MGDQHCREWCLKLGAAYAKRIRAHGPRPDDGWHLDEVFLKIQGKLQYLWRAVMGLVAASVLLAGALPVRADGITSEQAQQILDELRAIRKNLEQRPIAPAAAAPAPARPVDDKVSYAFPGSGFSIGSDDGPLVMVEYTDYQCPFCQRFHNTASVQIKTNYVDTGKLRYISCDFPLPFHENAQRSAVAGRCAAEQGKYWELRHTMIVNASQLQPDKIVGYAQSASLDVGKFKACIESDKYNAAIDKDIAEGTAAGVNGTPSFVFRMARSRAYGSSARCRTRSSTPRSRNS